MFVYVYGAHLIVDTILDGQSYHEVVIASQALIGEQFSIDLRPSFQHAVERAIEGGIHGDLQEGLRGDGGREARSM